MLAFNPLISVVIPTFNRATVLERALLSVLSQTYKNIELVIIDDASTDNTEEVVRRILSGQKYIYRRNTKNLRGGASRNLGVKLSSGQMIAFLDSDDFWTENKLEKQLKLLNENIIAGDFLLFSSVIFKSGMNEHVLPASVSFPHPIDDYLFTQNGLVQTSTMLAPRTLLLKIPFDETLIKHQDWDLCLRLGYAGVTFLGHESPLTVWVQDEPSCKRVSRVVNTGFSLQWINSHKENISQRAYWNFIGSNISSELVRSSSLFLRLKGIRLAISCLFNKGLSINRFNRQVLRALIPVARTSILFKR